MKQNIHPDYLQMVVTCACGNTFTVGGSRATLHVDVCNKCHPFITGTQKFIDAMGRVEKFTAKRKAASGYVKKNKKGQEVVDKTPKSLKEMLDAKKKLSKPESKAELVAEAVTAKAAV